MFAPRNNSSSERHTATNQEVSRVQGEPNWHRLKMPSRSDCAEAKSILISHSKYSAHDDSIPFVKYCAEQLLLTLQRVSGAGIVVTTACGLGCLGAIVQGIAEGNASLMQFGLLWFGVCSLGGIGIWEAMKSVHQQRNKTENNSKETI